MATRGLEPASQSLLSRGELIAELRRVGEERYHHRHPFHLRMHEGRLTRGQLQAWALNRYYYQSIIPVKDSIILSKSDNRTFRVAWRKRVIDHDGDGVNPGGMQKWLKLAEATGLSAYRVASEKEVLPATRYAGMYIRPCAKPKSGRRGSVLADGIVFKRPDYFTHGKAEAALSVAFGWPGLF